MFTWDRTSVLGCRTDGRGGVQILGFRPQWLVTVIILLAGSSLSRDVF